MPWCLVHLPILMPSPARLAGAGPKGAGGVLPRWHATP
ncbi:hypothetical protein I551_7612 [Mycobacterium ulcerans str. Harvey]|uniref:Uncharacterized protein n=1 Tax=Mycobacterium ulcerans str. Harvey TaxID=1299332 RepID=A0ABP3A2Y6_MYCUL|nr:hypothetical protein MMSP_1640 [Mycobacterium sp. 012931]EUA85925.1 hypothetical protein I551_7612 [Mycobacterium ulcerans str. Harvey]